MNKSKNTTMASGTGTIRNFVSGKDKAIARRIQAIWNSKKSELELTQVKAAKILGMSQPAFSQYLNGTLPLSTDYKLKVAELLKVNPGVFDETLEETLGKFEVKLNEVRFPVLHTFDNCTSRPSPFVTITDKEAARGCYAVLVNTARFEPLLPEGSHIIADPYSIIRVDTLCYIRAVDGMGRVYSIIGDVTSITKKHTTVVEIQNRNKPSAAKKTVLATDKMLVCHIVNTISFNKK